MINKLKGANLDIGLTSGGKTLWKQPEAMREKQ